MQFHENLVRSLTYKRLARTGDDSVGMHSNRKRFEGTEAVALYREHFMLIPILLSRQTNSGYEEL